MFYRQLGRTGLKVSVVSLGTWLTFAEQADRVAAEATLRAAKEAGINLFDTAEAYGAGAAEILLGETIGRLGWHRADYLLSTKLYGGLRDAVNMRETLNRKYLLQGIDGCLERLGTGHVDILYCHRHDPETPVEEVVWAMSDIIASGRAHYWGTSQWPPDRIREALEIADRRNLRAPSVEQVEYNLVRREGFERHYAPVARELGLGLCTWSPLASGLLTGKYTAAAPGSRAEIPGLDWLARQLLDPGAHSLATRLQSAANRFHCSAAQLAIAWCAANADVSSVILGARSPGQLRHNLGALAMVEQMDEATRSELGALVSC
jgi:voltage-dependent potassium channel beta subunit